MVVRTSSKLKGQVVAELSDQFGDFDAPFFSTVAAGIAAMAVGKFFYSLAPDGDPNEGQKRLYLRTAADPYYADQGNGAAPLNRALMQSHEQGKGASLVARKGGGYIEDAVFPDSRSAAVPYDASTMAGTGSPGAAALQDLADSGAAQVNLNSFYDAGDPSTGGTLLDSQVIVPTRQKWRGEGGKVKFVIAATDPCPNGYLLFGANASYQSAQAYALFGRQEIGGFYLDGRAAAAGGKSPVGIVIGSPGYKVHDVYAFSMQTIVRACELGGAGDGHADHLVISNVHLNNQPNPVDFDPTNAAAARYGIDWLRANTGADGAVIERCQSNVTGAGLTSKRCRFIGVRGFTNVHVRSIINGDVYFYQSTGKLSEYYGEHGQITICESQVVIENSHFWQRNELTVGADVGCVPVRVIPSGVNVPSSAPASLTIRDTAWNYDAGSALGGYSLGNHNFEIETTLYARAVISNCWRGAPFTNGRGWFERVGLTCGHPDFDNYSHFASIASEYVASGTTGGGRWLIEAERGPIDKDSATTVNGLETAAALSAGASGLLRWNAASGTYYYKAIIFHDKIRSIGIAGSLEVSASPVNGQGVVDLRLGYDIPANEMIRVYRGTASGSYDHYADVPVIEAGRLFDRGLDIATFPWQARAAGPIDAVNTGLSGGFSLLPGEITAASDAYGMAVAWSLTGDMPMVGGWRRDDEVRFVNPALTGTRRQTGWRRLTNCTSAAPAHVIGADWAPIYSIEPPSAPGVFTAGSASSVTLAAGQSFATVAPTGSSLDILNVAANEVEGYAWLLNVRSQNPGSYQVNIKKSTGSTSVTLRLSGLYVVQWRSDLLLWTAKRISGVLLSGTIDNGAAGLESTVSSSASAAAYPSWAERVLINSSVNALALTMPADAEIDGLRRRISVSAYTNAISLLKGSSGSVNSTAINATGEWEAVFTGGTWKATKLAELPA